MVTPAAFIGHGSPMNTLDRNVFTDAWRRLGSSVERPRAVLCVSAHWYTSTTAVTAMAHPRTIHDFFGFPDDLFAFEYPAAGAPALARSVAEALAPTRVTLDEGDWGLDHGTWSVLAHVFGDAEVPVLQLSIDAGLGFEDHIELGRRLAPLADEGVMVIGSGNVVHNLNRIDWGRPDEGFDWARRFDTSARELMTGCPSEMASLAHHRDVELAVPTPDHFIPLLYIAGLADARETTPQVLVDGYAYGSLSMISYTVGLDGAT